MAEVTLILQQVAAGEDGAEERLWTVVYQELRRIAREKMAGESRQVTLQATALVHEAWLRLCQREGGAAGWNGRSHFFAAAAEAMRRILVEQARRRLALKRGGRQLHLSLDEAVEVSAAADTKILEVDEALESLTAQDPRQAQIVKLLFFVGLSQKEVAVLLDVSEKTVQRQWILAKAILYQGIKARRSLDREFFASGENR